MSFLCISLNIITVKPVVSKRVQRRNVVELLKMHSSEEELKKKCATYPCKQIRTYVKHFKVSTLHMR